MLAFGSGDGTSLDKLVAPILVRRFGDPPQVAADQRWSAGQIGRYLAQFPGATGAWTPSAIEELAA